MSDDGYPELLADLAARAAEVLRAEGMTDERARAVAFKLAESVREHWAGQLVYVPVGSSYEMAQRDAEMFGKFNGRNHADLAREYGVNFVSVYRIIKRMAKAARERDQTDLFAPPASSSPP